MENLSLLDANKPDKVRDALNELIQYKNSATEIPLITAETLGLGNVENTKDIDKPLSIPQKNYIDNENEKDIKLSSEKLQKIDSDLEIADGKTIFAERGNGDTEPLISVQNEGGFENVTVGTENIPLKLYHSKKDINNSIVSKNPKILIKDEFGNKTEDNVALLSDIDNLKGDLTTKLNNGLGEKVDKNVLVDAETQNAVVTAVEGTNFAQPDIDDMSIRVVKRSLVTGAILRETSIPIKVASPLTRGLMTKEQVAALENLISRVGAMEGKASRYIYTKKTSPSAAEIDAFVKGLGYKAPYSGVAVVVEGTYHIWHYYENNDIGWRDDGADTVNKATNNTLGIVLGSNVNGKIYIEADGTMSLVGFEHLSNGITSLENTRLTDIHITGGNENGTIKFAKNVNGTSSTPTEVAITGLKSAAYTESSAYATNEQGEKADSAIQSVKLNGVEQTKTNNGINLIIDTVSQANMENYVNNAIQTAIGEAIGGSY